MTKREQRAIRFPGLSPIILPHTFAFVFVKEISRFLARLSFFMLGMVIGGIVFNIPVVFSGRLPVVLTISSIYFVVLEAKFNGDAVEELNQFKSKHEGFLNESEESQEQQK